MTDYFILNFDNNYLTDGALQEIENCPYEFRPDSPGIDSKFLTILTFEVMFYLLLEALTEIWYRNPKFLGSGSGLHQSN
jgi:hypothetical protein